MPFTTSLSLNNVHKSGLLGKRDWNFYFPDNLGKVATFYGILFVGCEFFRLGKFLVI
jgi:hypothetical protein